MLYEIIYKFYKALLFSENEIETINNLNSMTKKPNDLYLDPKQRALNTWRGRLQHFLQILYNQKMIVI